MAEDQAADPYGDRYGASYSIYGDLDVDALLAIAQLAAARVALEVVGYPCDDHPGP
jgi:hypothetical protein